MEYPRMKEGREDTAVRRKKRTSNISLRSSCLRLDKSNTL